MKKWLFGIFSLYSALAFAQPGDDDIEYFTDADITRSRFSAAILFNPNYTNRRLINDEVPSGGGYDLINENADGSFQLNYNAEVFYALGSAFDIGVGFGRTTADYSVNRVQYYENRNDTVNAKLEVAISMYTIPLKLNFNTRVNDLWALEVVPAVEFNIMDEYDQRITPNGESTVSSDLSSEKQPLNYTVSLSLGGTYYLTESWGVVIRANGRYMLNPIIEKTNFPRETTYSFGANIGLRYKF
jgi:hypothetical protein